MSVDTVVFVIECAVVAAVTAGLVGLVVYCGVRFGLGYKSDVVEEKEEVVEESPCLHCEAEKIEITPIPSVPSSSKQSNPKKDTMTAKTYAQILKEERIKRTEFQIEAEELDMRARAREQLEREDANKLARAKRDADRAIRKKERELRAIQREHDKQLAKMKERFNKGFTI